jgi:hypothetical protein
MNDAYYFFIGWLVILGMIAGGIRFEPTRVLIYYVLWLTIIFTVITNNKEFGKLLNRGAP